MPLRGSFTKTLCAVVTMQLLAFSYCIPAFAQNQSNAAEQSTSQAARKLCEDPSLVEEIEKYRDAGLQEYLHEICLILLAQREFGKSFKYLKHRARWISQQHLSRDIKVPVLLATKKHLTKASVYLERAIAGFRIKKKAVIKLPNKMLGQLMQANGLIHVFLEGRHTEGSRYGYDIHMVHKRIGLALKYSMVWAKEGFK